jgi:hypothetical protein
MRKSKIFTFLFVSLSLISGMAFADSEIVVCGNSNGTLVKAIYSGRDATLLSLTVKGKQYISEAAGGIKCQRQFYDGSSSQICDLGNNIIASVFLRSYAPHSGVIVYKNDRSISDDLGLVCQSVNL